ncbi:PLP-dependent aminotransferase family protein [Sanguibacter antarcticus]|uniref:GntR family transcriptional regulator n=1 Tax=Sanguibacter antarcticus TaxID=372484 RepID=A0A2A9E2L6_9MICO|nr:PLP-dependent aminotransferase family protein [Sanguibacter antarcticus]PFG32430.1 GntR family transcriptional regulator [Sanguibacter antarcticus]
MVEPRISPDALCALLGPAQPGTPAYRWLSERITLLVADGRVLPGARLPSERALSTASGMSRTTIVRAFSHLMDTGFLDARRGSGRVVRLPVHDVPRAREPIPTSGSHRTTDTPLDLTSAAPSAAPGVFEALRSALDALPSYTAGSGYVAGGLPVLRRAIADDYTRRGLATDPENVLVTSGALDAISLLARHLVRPGSRVVVETPGYPNVFAALRLAGARLVGVPVNSPEVDVPALLDAARTTGAVAILVTADFHNPTGRLLDESARTALVDGARRLGIRVVADETLAEIRLDQDLPMPSPVGGHGSGAMLVGSAAKTYWGGLRLGWIRASRRTVADLARARLSGSLADPVLEQLALATLLHDQPGIGDERRAHLRDARDTAVRFARERLPGWDVPVPPGGLSLWCRLPVPASSELALAAGRRGIALAPGSSFSATGQGLEHHVRIPFTLQPDDLAHALDGVAQAFDALGPAQ